MPNTTVSDVMTHHVISIKPSTPYKAIVRALVEHDISAVPVVDEAWHVEGVVSEADLIPKEALAEEDQPGHWDLLVRHARRTADKAHATTAVTLMTGPAITIGPNAGLPPAARLMTRHAVKRLPVVDGDGVLVGIVSRHDLLSAFLRPDEDLREAIVGEILIGAMAVNPFTLDVQVHDGVVTLAGQLENDAVIVETLHLVRKLDGVVDVIDKLTPPGGPTGVNPPRTP
jgi:CBS domain-containing protein